MLLNRIDNQVAATYRDLPEKPSLTAKRFWYDTVGHGALPALRCACEAFVPEHLVTGEVPSATDLELSVRTSCEAKIKKEGAGTIPAKKLLELVRLLPEGEIKFKLLENHWVEIVSDKKKYKLVGMAKENFPALPAMPVACDRPAMPTPTSPYEASVPPSESASSCEPMKVVILPSASRPRVSLTE